MRSVGDVLGPQPDEDVRLVREVVVIVVLDVESPTRTGLSGRLALAQEQ